MKDFFAYRFNLDECYFGKSADQKKAISAMFDCEVSLLEECFSDYETHLQRCVSELSSDKYARIFKEKYENERVAFFGDSLTSDKLSYARILSRLLKRAENYGVSNNTSSCVLRLLEWDIGKNRPELYSLFIGTNDAEESCGQPITSISEYERNVRLILTRLSGADGVIVLLPGRFGGRNQNNVDAQNAVLKRLAEEFRLKTIDTFFIRAKEDYEPDGVHLSPAGQFKLAKAFVKTVAGD